MPCLINNGLSNDTCQFLIGGLKKVYIANRSDVVAFVDSDMDNVYDSVTMATHSGTASVFYSFDISKNTSSYAQTLTVNGSNKYIAQSVDFFVPRSDQEAYDVAEQIALGNFVAIVENRMGYKIVLGQYNGLEASVGEINSGVAEGDSAAIHFTLAGAELGYGKQFVGTIPV